MIDDADVSWLGAPLKDSFKRLVKRALIELLVSIRHCDCLSFNVEITHLVHGVYGTG